MASKDITVTIIINFEDLEATAKEFGRVALHLPEHSKVIVFDDTLVGDDCIKSFNDDQEGITKARRYAVKLWPEDETSDEPFEKLRQDYLDILDSFDVPE